MNRLQQELEGEALNTEDMEAVLAAAGTESTTNVGDNEVPPSPQPAPAPSSPGLSPERAPDERRVLDANTLEEGLDVIPSSQN